MKSYKTILCFMSFPKLPINLRDMTMGDKLIMLNKTTTYVDEIITLCWNLGEPSAYFRWLSGRIMEKRSGTTVQWFHNIVTSGKVCKLANSVDNHGGLQLPVLGSNPTLVLTVLRINVRWSKVLEFFFLRWKYGRFDAILRHLTD